MEQLGKFLGTLMSSRTQAHIFHLQTQSFATHKALNKYYDEIIDLLDAFDILLQQNKNFQLILIGDLTNVSNNISVKLNYYFEKYPSQIKCTGYLKSSEVASLLANSDILINPRPSGISAEAGFPTKLGEYFAAKKPVIATRVGDLIKYFNDDEILILTEPNNPIDLADKILRLAQDNDKMRKLGSNGYKWMMTNLHYNISALKLIQFIEKQ